MTASSGGLRGARLRSLARIPAGVYASLAVLYAAGIFLLSSLSGDDLGDFGRFGSYLSNLLHAPLFGGLGALVAMALLTRGGGRPELGWKRGLLTATICGVYAISDEWHQSRVAGRSPDPLDLVTDLAGVLTAVAAIELAVVGAKRPRRWLALLAGAVLVGSVSALIAADIF